MTPLTFTLTRHVNGGRPVVRLERALARHEGDCVPAGFETDFASTFPLLGMVSPALAVFGRSCVAAVGHDWDCYRRVGRAERSARFLRQMLNDGVPRLQADLQWAAVRFWPTSERVVQWGPARCEARRTQRRAGAGWRGVRHERRALP